MINLMIDDDTTIRLKAEGRLPALVADFACGVRAVARLIAENLPSEAAQPAAEPPKPAPRKRAPKAAESKAAAPKPAARKKTAAAETASAEKKPRAPRKKKAE